MTLPITDEMIERAATLFANVLRDWWTFDDHQQHTHSWHTREDFIELRLPALTRAALETALKGGE